MQTLFKRTDIMKRIGIPILGISMLLLFTAPGNAAAPTTRQQTILPRAIPPGTPAVAPSNVADYATYGYSAWDIGGGTNEGRKFDIMTNGYTGAGNSARLLTFFSITDIHITDKESPAEVPYMGWTADFRDDGPGGLAHSAYSPVIFDTTRHLDAAVRTINSLHQQLPFNFGMVLGDNCNSSQRNELRWFIDVMDGQYIVPSSGDHAGADTIDYQMPFQAAGLNPEIPWFEAIGNHDQFWMGIGYPSDKVRQAQVGSNILEISTNGPLFPPYGAYGEGMYVGAIDGTTTYGTVVKWGFTNLFATPPTVVADTNRITLSTDVSAPTNYVNEFFNTTTLPVGHGFNLALGQTGSLTACYTFEPVTNMPIKVIVLDDTCKSNAPGQNPNFYGAGWVDAARYTWLTNELQMGQNSNQLMIIAAHIPILPRTSLADTNSSPMFYPDPDNQTETNLIATFHRYPNLIMVMAGHRHANVVTPFPSPDPAHPEYGFWEVESASLRDFPRQLRTYDIRRNTDNTISILTTDVDPRVETNTCAWKSLGYTVGAARIFGDIDLDDTTSHAYNAELVKQLTPAMQATIAQYGAPLQAGGNDYDGDGRSDLAVYDNNLATWYAYSLQLGRSTLWAQSWGWPGAEIVPGDFDGDSISDLGVYDHDTGFWYVWSKARHETLVWQRQWWPGSKPVCGDYNGDGKSDLAVYEQTSGAWYILTSSNSVLAWQRPWGGPGYSPVSGDFDGDKVSDLGVYDIARGYWYVQTMAGDNIAWQAPWGWAGATTVPGDYDGDGKDDLAVYDPLTGNWYAWSLARHETLVWQQQWGGPSAVPVPGDYDGDAIADLATFDVTTGAWDIWSVANNAVIALQQPWGWAGAIPIAGRESVTSNQ